VSLEVFKCLKKALKTLVNSQGGEEVRVMNLIKEGNEWSLMEKLALVTVNSTNINKNEVYLVMYKCELEKLDWIMYDLAI